MNSFCKQALMFPEYEVKHENQLTVSKSEIRSLCNLKPLTSIATSISRYVVARNKTHEMGKQYAEMRRVVDIQYSEMERQAQIRFQEMTARLEEEYRVKITELDVLLAKAEMEADTAYSEHRSSFEKYLKKSRLYKEIFDILSDEAKKTFELIQYDDENQILAQTRYSIELREKYRILINGISKYTSYIV